MLCMGHELLYIIFLAYIGMILAAVGADTGNMLILSISAHNILGKLVDLYG